MAGRLVIPQYMPARDANGDAYPGAKLFVYLPNTTTLATIYADNNLSAPLSNPVIANSGGYFPAIWAANSTVFSVSLTDSMGAPIVGYDGITVTMNADTAAAIIAQAAADASQQYSTTAQMQANAASAAAGLAEDYKDQGYVYLQDTIAAAAGAGATPSIAAIGPLTPAADQMITFTGPTTAALVPTTAYGRGLLSTASGSALATAIGAVDLSSSQSLSNKTIVAPAYSGNPITSLPTNGQVVFPATANPSGDANTLDDYRESDVAPTLSAATTPPTGVTYNAGGTTLRGTKVGRVQHFQVRVQATNIGSGGVGNVRIVLTGMPNAAVATGFSVSVCDFFSISAGSVPTVTMAAGGNILELRAQSNTANTAVTYSAISNGFTIIVNGSYVAA